VGPGGTYAELVAALKPEGDLFDGGLLQVARQRGLAGSDGGAGEDVAAGVRRTSDGRWKIGDGRCASKRRLCDSWLDG
jgi:hypothetical protein